MSADYVNETIRRLHPGSIISTDAADGELAYAVVPSAARPALIVPAGRPRVSSAAARAYAAPKGVRARARTVALRLVFRSHLGDHIFRDRIFTSASSEPGLAEHLSQVLGQEVTLAFPVGRSRANRKPVVQAINAAGRVLAFAKLGVNPLTDQLVTHECEELARLSASEIEGVRVPVVLEAATWRGHPLLVTEPLLDRRRRGGPDAGAVTRAMRGVARSAGVDSMKVSELAWWRQVGDRLDDLPDSGPAVRLRAVRQSLEHHADTLVWAGSWHGDWNQGNYASVGDELFVWDWERSAVGVPVGWDALHLALWSVVPASGAPSPESLGTLLRDTRQLMEPVGADPGTCDLVATLYLLEFGSRLVTDDQDEFGAIGDITTWLLPVLESRVAGLVPDTSRCTSLRPNPGEPA